ncbi:MAG: putative DNA binding domain-containing protein [Phycisphaerae bacterium]|nr:putative DNA binding domain-containing protein [Phycisphaerae bacterium]
MARYDNPEYLAGLLHELCQLPHETEWVEFKCNNDNPVEIGEYISALANSAALKGKTNAYLVWGVVDKSHEVVGATFRPTEAKKGNEELENWLVRLLNPRIHFRFIEFDVDGKHIAMIEIPRAAHQPVQFQGVEYIRVGSYKKKLKDYAEKARELWRIFDVTPFEHLVAAERIDASDVLNLLDYPAYFKLLDMPLPESRDGILQRLADDHMIETCQGGGWNILNLGAILFASDLSKFRHLARKAMRVIEYDGDGRVKTKREYGGHKGYATGFEGLIGFLKGILPENEVIGEALRKTVPMYPELAIRELVANVLIHQDFTISGAGPMVEVFDGRLEITNPGEPLVDTQRFLDTPPQSRNEALASFLRRVGICEERGSGIDKVVSETEFYQLPAPLFEVVGGHTRAVLFAHKPFAEMDKADRIRACYLHACLQYVQRKFMTNSTLRDRFGIASNNRAQASRLIKAALQAGKIRQNDPEGESRKDTKYVPFWV